MPDVLAKRFDIGTQVQLQGATVSLTVSDRALSLP
jgi:hypothetical protein